MQVLDVIRSYSLLLPGRGIRLDGQDGGDENADEGEVNEGDEDDDKLNGGSVDALLYLVFPIFCAFCDVRVLDMCSASVLMSAVILAVLTRFRQLRFTLWDTNLAVVCRRPYDTVRGATSLWRTSHGIDFAKCY